MMILIRKFFSFVAGTLQFTIGQTTWKLSFCFFFSSSGRFSCNTQHSLLKGAYVKLCTRNKRFASEYSTQENIFSILFSSNVVIFDLWYKQAFW